MAQNYIEKHTAAVAKLIRQGFKKELGAVNTRQNYKGTGGNAGLRQLWVRFDNGAVIDIWIGYRQPRLGAVCARHAERGHTKAPRIDFEDDYTNPQAAYEAIFAAVKQWLKADQEAA